MRPVAAVLVALALAPAPALADAPPRLVAVSLRVSTTTRTVHLNTVVSDDGGQVLERRYRTTLRYRCGSGRWRIARRTARGAASTTLAWRYAAVLGGRTCAFRVSVTRVRGGSARSAILTRLL